MLDHRHEPFPALIRIQRKIRGSARDNGQNQGKRFGTAFAVSPTTSPGPIPNASSPPANDDAAAASPPYDTVAAVHPYRWRLRRAARVSRESQQQGI
jgi:hypothetical protein